MDGVIVVDDELQFLGQIPLQNQQQLMMHRPGPSSRRVSDNVQPVQYARRGRGIKRTRNGTKVLPAADMIPQFFAEPEPSVPSAVPAEDPAQYESSVIVDGQDIYYIQEVQDESDQIVLVPDEEQADQYLQPNTLVPAYDGGSETDEAPEVTDVEQLQAEAEDYYNVEPLELSDIWNDLITANQEILILLELPDLKHHIVDARKIEEQIRDMGCEYCGRVFPDIQAWDRHIRKIHFHTELFECDSCDGKFRYFARFKDHLNGHTGQRVYQCDECNHHYAFRMGFLVHKILDHMKLNGIYVCPKCDLDCRDAQNYKLHIASHIEFGPSSVQRSSGVAYAATNNTAARPSSNAVRKSNAAEVVAVKPPFYAKESERNKFLNVFESFSKNRKKDLSIATTTVKKRK